jgi:cytochrome o ubiquinol oxidase subunit 1
MLALDRTLGMHFFTGGFGGNAMMYVNLIWAWGHPEVYILVLPAFGVFSEIVPVFSRKRLFGYTSMVLAIWGIVILSFGVWLHHFFTMGAGADVNAVFGIATMLIAVPTGVKIFNWLFTMYKGRIRFAAPMNWFMGFVFLFTLGGVTGVLMAVPPIDFQVHNSLFLVAHFHTMIVSGVLFGYFAGLQYWFPKYFGFSLSDRLGKYAARLWIAGFTLAFTPLYILGLMGATRRLDHYGASTGWQPLFIVAGIGVLVIGLGVLVQLTQLALAIGMRKWRVASSDPWDGRTLEWATVSPPPSYNFAVIPTADKRDAFWEAKRSHTNLFDADLEPFEEVKNTGAGFGIGMLAIGFGFAMIWHIWWLAAIGLLGIITVILWRTSLGDKGSETISTKVLKEAQGA